MKNPEEVDRKVEAIKKLEKLKYFELNQHLVISKDNLSHLVHSSVNRLFNAKSYKLFDNKYFESKLTKEKMNITEAKKMIDTCYPMFVEAVIALGGYWFLCIYTSERYQQLR